MKRLSRPVICILQLLSCDSVPFEKKIPSPHEGLEVTYATLLFSERRDQKNVERYDYIFIETPPSLGFCRSFNHASLCETATLRDIKREKMHYIKRIFVL